MASNWYPTKVRDQLKNLSDDFIQCRDMGHAMRNVARWVDLLDRRGNPKEICRYAKCIRCGTKRYTYYTYPEMERITANYHHPEGYVVEGGRPPRSAILLEAMNREGELLPERPEDPDNYDLTHARVATLSPGE